MCKSKDSLWELVFSYCRVGPGDEILVLGLGADTFTC